MTDIGAIAGAAPAVKVGHIVARRGRRLALFLHGERCRIGLGGAGCRGHDRCMPLVTGSTRATGRAVVLRAVLAQGPVARSTIARHTGLSPAAVTRHTADLAAFGLIRELPAEPTEKRMGRPHTPLDIELDLQCRGRHPHRRDALHVDHHGSARAGARAGAAAAPGHRFEHGAWRRCPPPVRLRRRPGQWPGAARGRGRRGWLGGPGARDSGGTSSAGWRDVPVRDFVAGHTGLPVRVDSHARALVRAEQMFGLAGTADSVVHLFVGNVVDAAIVTGDAVHHGPRSAAGDIAHQPLGDPAVRCPCGRLGCRQATVSDRAFADRAVRHGIIGAPSMAALLAAAVRGDPAACQLFCDRATSLGGAVALLLDVLNPEVLMVTEAGLLHLPDCLDVLHAEVRRRSHVCADPIAQVRVPGFAPGDVLAVTAGTVLLDVVYTNPAAMEQLGSRHFPIRAPI